MKGGWIYARRAAAALIPVALSGCVCRGEEPAIDPADIPIGGWYRAEIRADGHVIPFFLSLPADHDSAGARVRNGQQEIVADHAWRAARVTVDFPVFRTRIDAGADASGALAGSFRHESPAFGDSELALSAAPVSEPDPEDRFATGSGRAHEEVPERWHLRFEESGDAQLALSRGGESALEGALMLGNGNIVYLAGNARGGALSLSGFDGSSPYLLEASFVGDRPEGGKRQSGTAQRRKLEGEWLAGPGLRWRESITGTVDPDVSIDANVSLSPGTYRLPVPELSQAPYAGSPVILALTGSWSPASMRAVPFLNELYTEHRDAGLEIVALNYELTEDEAYNDAAAERIAALRGVPWKIIPVDGVAADFAAAVPAGLEHIDVQSFPVLAFVDRDGTVRDVRAGFPPEAAGELYERAVADYRELAAAIAADDR